MNGGMMREEGSNGNAMGGGQGRAEAWGTHGRMRRGLQGDVVEEEFKTLISTTKNDWIRNLDFYARASLKLEPWFLCKLKPIRGGGCKALSLTVLLCLVRSIVVPVAKHILNHGMHFLGKKISGCRPFLLVFAVVGVIGVVGLVVLVSSLHGLA
ncbi:hypothetical protein Acr_10g0002890 [Actinidia rufa]|uniref:Uncharacterized protein n=1 Tax=Actinidia rufa TaxID=165716 RepID=A0A7J0F871_9ERIC|nr:hypothetical protein Acr_10g0002890 [Actinidia rufa]